MYFSAFHHHNLVTTGTSNHFILQTIPQHLTFTFSTCKIVQVNLFGIFHYFSQVLFLISSIYYLLGFGKARNPQKIYVIYSHCCHAIIYVQQVPNKLVKPKALKTTIGKRKPTSFHYLYEIQFTQGRVTTCPFAGYSCPCGNRKIL